MFLSKYGVARHIYIPLVKRGVVDFAVSADYTASAGDVKISKDGGAASNVTNLPTAITMGNTAMWDFSLTATEMQAAQIKITVADSATKAVEDTMFMIETYGNASAQHEADFDTAAMGALMPTTAGRTLDVSAGGEAGLDWANVGSPTTSLNLSGTTVGTASAVTTVNGLANNVITAASAASDFGAEIQALITGGAYALSTDANGRIRIVDGTGTGEINTNAGAIALVDLVTDITTKTGYRLSATGVDDIWDEPMAAHTTADTPGNVLNMLTQDTVTLSTDVAIGSIIGQLLDAGTSWSYDRTTDSQEALRDRGDAAWITATGFSTLDAAGVRTAVGLASANLDTQLDALPTANEVRNAVTGGSYALDTDANGRVRIVDGTGAGEINTNAGAIALVDTVTTLTNAPSDSSGVTTLLSRVTSTRAGYWDNLSAGAVATAASVAALNNLSASQVNAEVVDALATDTYAEPSQGAPGATISLAAKIGYLYTAWRNKKIQTATLLSLFADNESTVITKSTVSDDGTTYTSGEFVTGA